MYTRPDMAYTTPLSAFDLQRLQDFRDRGEDAWLRASWQSWFGDCDRFAIGTPGAMTVWGKRLHNTIEYINQGNRLGSETYLHWAMRKYVHLL